MRVRDAAVDDVDELVALVEAAYRGEPTATTWTTEAELVGGQRVDRTMALASIADPDTRVLLGTDGTTGALLACCEVRGPDRSGRSVLGMFAVDPHRHGAGLGRSMLAAGERVAVELGALAIDLHVLDVRHELISWYERRGYLRTGERVAFPYGDERFGVPKRDDLSFTVLRKPMDPGASAAPGSASG